MNFKICEVCPYKGDDYFFCFFPLDMSNYNNFFGVKNTLTDLSYTCDLYVGKSEERHEYDFRNHVRLEDIRRVYGDDNVFPDKRCPYYMEHQIYDLNKEK